MRTKSTVTPATQGNVIFVRGEPAPNDVPNEDPPIGVGESPPLRTMEEECGLVSMKLQPWDSEGTVTVTKIVILCLKGQLLQLSTIFTLVGIIVVIGSPMTYFYFDSRAWFINALWIGLFMSGFYSTAVILVFNQAQLYDMTPKDSDPQFHVGVANERLAVTFGANVIANGTFIGISWAFSLFGGYPIPSIFGLYFITMLLAYTLVAGILLFKRSKIHHLETGGHKFAKLVIVLIVTSIVVTASHFAFIAVTIAMMLLQNFYLQMVTVSIGFPLVSKLLDIAIFKFLNKLFAQTSRTFDRDIRHSTRMLQQIIRFRFAGYSVAYLLPWEGFWVATAINMVSDILATFHTMIWHTAELKKKIPPPPPDEVYRIKLKKMAVTTFKDLIEKVLIVVCPFLAGIAYCCVLKISPTNAVYVDSLGYHFPSFEVLALRGVIRFLLECFSDLIKNMICWYSFKVLPARVTHRMTWIDCLLAACLTMSAFGFCFTGMALAVGV
jgi:hypothetical protein